MTNKPGTLVILTPGFPSNESDTTCLPLQQQFIKKIKENYPALQIIVLSFQYPYRRADYSWNGIAVKSFGGKNRGGFQRWLCWQQVKKELNHLHAKYQIKGIISFWLGECAFVGKKFADRHQLKHYCWLLGQDAKKGNRYYNRIKPGAQELVALSDFIQDSFEKNYGIRPAHIIPPGIDTSLFSHLSSDRPIDLLAVGSLIPLKQFNIFIEIVAAIKKEFPAVRALLCGDGPERKKLQQRAASLGLANNIQLTGQLPHPEILKLMQQSKVLLHPSQYEGFGVVMLEAIYAGASVISFVQPVKKEINNWYIAATPGEMQEKADKLLHSSPASRPDHFEYLVENCAKSFMAFFDTAK